MFNSGQSSGFPEYWVMRINIIVDQSTAVIIWRRFGPVENPSRVAIPYTYSSVARTYT